METNLAAQRFYNVTTELLSCAPSGRLEDGATTAYHHALQELTELRRQLRDDAIVEHDEAFWKGGGMQKPLFPEVKSGKVVRSICEHVGKTSTVTVQFADGRVLRMSIAVGGVFQATEVRP